MTDTTTPSSRVEEDDAAGFAAQTIVQLAHIRAKLTTAGVTDPRLAASDTELIHRVLVHLLGLPGTDNLATYMMVVDAMARRFTVAVSPIDFVSAVDLASLLALSPTGRIHNIIYDTDRARLRVVVWLHQSDDNADCPSAIYTPPPQLAPRHSDPDWVGAKINDKDDQAAILQAMHVVYNMQSDMPFMDVHVERIMSKDALGRLRGAIASDSTDKSTANDDDNDNNDDDDDESSTGGQYYNRHGPASAVAGYLIRFTNIPLTTSAFLRHLESVLGGRLANHLVIQSRAARRIPAPSAEAESTAAAAAVAAKTTGPHQVRGHAFDLGVALERVGHSPADIVAAKATAQAGNQSELAITLHATAALGSSSSGAPLLESLPAHTGTMAPVKRAVLQAKRTSVRRAATAAKRARVTTQ